MRLWAVRVVSGLFGLSWILLPGFGVIDLAFAWNPDWPQVLEAGWGLFATVITGSAFVRVAARPEAWPTAVTQLAVATVALLVSALAAEERGLLWLTLALGLQTAIVASLAATIRGPTSPPHGRMSIPLLVLALAGALPWLVYATDMWSLNRENRIDADITNGIDHYSMQGALALALALLTGLAGLRSQVRPFVPLCAGVAAAYLGLVSLAWPDSAAGVSREWSIAAIAWGGAVTLGGLVHKGRG